MGIPDGAHSHGHGGGGLGTAVLVILAAAVLGPAVAAAAAAIVHALIIAAVLLGLTAAGLVALGGWRLRQQQPEPPQVVHHIIPAPARPSQALPEQPPAIERPRDIHLHFHGVAPADVAAIIREQEQR